jgi:hypothetical protein
MLHSRSTRRPCSVPIIFVHLLAPMFSIPAQGGHLTVTRRAHHPLANRTHAIIQTFSLLNVMQTNLSPAALHVSESKAANARHTSRPRQRRHACRRQRCNNASEHRTPALRMPGRNCSNRNDSRERTEANHHSNVTCETIQQ